MDQELEKWLNSCVRGKRISRNTIAVGIVVIDHLRVQGPVSKNGVLSNGGEIKGARSGLGNILEKYHIPKEYLKEITTRQAHQDGQRLFEIFKWGEPIRRLTFEERDKLLGNLGIKLAQSALDWMQKQNLKLEIDRGQDPTSWIHLIIENAKARSGGVVEQHLIGAKLERRFKNIIVPNHPAHAADVQTSRDGDFVVSRYIYHVTASPGRSVIQKCVANLRAGKSPILLVPSEKVNKAKALSEDEGVLEKFTIISIEDFIALNIIELAIEENKENFAILKEIVDVYNRRLTKVETDLSLIIDVK
ncbi:MAG: DUF4928 family protein [Bellilinea sp.]